MMEILNGKERTITQVRELMEQTGWKLVQVDQATGISTAKAIAIPV